MAAEAPGKITPKTGISSFSLTSSQTTAVAVLQAKTIILTFWSEGSSPSAKYTREFGLLV